MLLETFIMSCFLLLVLTGALFFLFRLLDRIIRSFRVGKYETRYILVTGCDTGFGSILCKRLDNLGCHVFAGCYTESGLQEITKSCSSRLHALLLDVTKPESIREAFHTVKSKLPPGKGLWALMNNAGLMGPVAPPEWLSMSDYRFVTDVNLFGLVDTTMTFLPLIKQARGRVVSTSSVAGRMSLGNANPYHVSKYGVEAFMDGLRRTSYIYGVKCSLIEPGIHLTTFWQKTSSTERVRHLVIKSWDELDVEVKEEFGREYYDKFTHTFSEKFTSWGSGKLDDVVDAYEHAILSLYPKSRYVVGVDAWILWIPITWMPDWLSDWILRQLSKGDPLPAMLSRPNKRVPN